MSQDKFPVGSRISNGSFETEILDQSQIRFSKNLHGYVIVDTVEDLETAGFQVVAPSAPKPLTLEEMAHGMKYWFWGNAPHEATYITHPIDHALIRAGLGFRTAEEAEADAVLKGWKKE